MATTEDAVVVTRVFDAPRDNVFAAWTEAERVKVWWGPRGFTTPVVEIDARPGGVSFSCMRSPEGQDVWGTGVYREVVEPERIVVTDSFSDAEGNVVPASHYGMEGEWPLEMLITVSFEDVDGRTKLTLRHEGIPAGENAEMCEAGWSESFDKLEEYLASEGL